MSSTTRRPVGEGGPAGGPAEARETAHAGERLAAEYAGVPLVNPVLLAPGPPTSRTSFIVRGIQAGAAGVVVKTAVSDSLGVMRIQPRPRFRLVDWDGRTEGTERYVLYSIDQAFPGDVDCYCRFLQDVVRAAEGRPVFGSLLASSPEEWRHLAARLGSCGISALEMDVSCPHSADRDSLATIVEQVQAAVDGSPVPVAAKLPLRPDVPLLAERVLRAGAAGVVLANRPAGLDVDLETMAPVMHRSIAGHGGPWTKYAVLAQVLQVYRHLGCPVSATGGVTDPGDAIKYLLAGAGSVQVCSAVIVSGFPVITSIVDGIGAYVSSRGTTVKNLVGKAVSSFLELGQIARGGDLVAWIAPGSCISCGRCHGFCFHEAIRVAGDDGRRRVDTRMCSGCGLCAQPRVCPVGAIKMITPGGEGNCV